MPAHLMFKDDANRVNNTNLGVNWDERQGDWEVNANLFRAQTVGVSLALWKGQPPTNYEVIAVDVEGAVPVLGNALALRVQGGATPDMYFAGFLGLSGGGTSALQVAKRVSSVVTQIGSNITVTRGATKKLRFVMQESRLRTYYDGAFQHDLTDTVITAAGSAGIYSDVTLRRWDNVEVRGEFFWTFVPNAYELTPLTSTESVEYESGFVQRNKIWVRPRMGIRIAYDAVTDTEKRDMQEFFLRRGGAFEPFLIADPVSANPTDLFFELGDGVRTKFKLVHDWFELASTKTNGVVDSPQPVKDFTTGVVTYTAAPAKGAVLTADITNGRYRVRFSEDQLRFRRHVHDRWSLEAELVQDKTLLDGAAVA